MTVAIQDNVLSGKELQEGVLPSKEKYFRSLLMAPKVAWPTVFVFLLAAGLMVTTWTMCLMDRWPLWVGMLTNGFSVYLLFSVAHDGVHRALSRYPIINESLSRFALLMMLPMAPFEGVRWLHMQHHRFTNGKKDPDGYVHWAPWYLKPILFASVDVLYSIYFVRHGGEQLKKHLRPIAVATAIFAAVLAVLISAGYGWEVLFLFFLASRVGLFLIALVFSYLPHVACDTPAEVNEYRATSIRRGFEWLLTPLLMYQNYHLIHHLFPTVPFYRYFKVWYLKYDELVAKDPAVQEAFSMKLTRAAPAS
jgi:fatty acid desaturase